VLIHRLAVEGASWLGHDAEEAWLADMTNWAIPQFPRNQVDKAGFTLVDPSAPDDQLEWAIGVINNWRSSHSYPLLNFRINLRRKVKTIEANALVAQRIKRLQSIKAKLQRESSMQLSQMQDIGGCRAVLRSVKQVERLVESYRKSSFAHLFKGEKNYIAHPKGDGYRGHHLIYQYKSLPNQNSAYDKLRIEVQIRTAPIRITS
jgi:(p)ppGpp synthase/HD superfamily hydrolase